jgi:hypothetical protein
MFWFIQYCPWFIRKHKDTVRLFIGRLAYYKDRCEVWDHWPVDNRLLSRADFYGHSDEQSEDVKLKITADLRKHIKWHTSFLEVFDMDR